MTNATISKRILAILADVAARERRQDLRGVHTFADFASRQDINDLARLALLLAKGRVHRKRKGRYQATGDSEEPRR